MIGASEFVAGARDVRTPEQAIAEAEDYLNSMFQPSRAGDEGWLDAILAEATRAGSMPSERATLTNPTAPGVGTGTPGGITVEGGGGGGGGAGGLGDLLTLGVLGYGGARGFEKLTGQPIGEFVAQLLTGQSAAERAAAEAGTGIMGPGAVEAGSLPSSLATAGAGLFAATNPAARTLPGTGINLVAALLAGPAAIPFLVGQGLVTLPELINGPDRPTAQTRWRAEQQGRRGDVVMALRGAGSAQDIADIFNMQAGRAYSAEDVLNPDVLRTELGGELFNQTAGGSFPNLVREGLYNALVTAGAPEKALAVVRPDWLTSRPASVAPASRSDLQEIMKSTLQGAEPGPTGTPPVDISTIFPYSSGDADLQERIKGLLAAGMTQFQVDRALGRPRWAEGVHPDVLSALDLIGPGQL